MALDMADCGPIMERLIWTELLVPLNRTGSGGFDEQRDWRRARRRNRWQSLLREKKKGSEFVTVRNWERNVFGLRTIGDYIYCFDS